MSTTSSKRIRYKESKGSRDDRDLNISKSSSHNYNNRHGIKHPQPQKWSNEKVIDELSSFIAEFSYLTDEPNKNYQFKETTPIQTYNKYAANTKGNEPPRRRHSSRRHSDKHVDFITTPGSTSEEVMHRGRSPRHRKLPSSGRLERYPRKPSRHDRKKSYKSFGSKSRSRSRSKENINKRNTKISRKHKSRRSRSNHSAFKITPLRHRRKRSRSSRSFVKEMPYYYEKRKSRGSKQVIVKRPILYKCEKRENKQIKIENKEIKSENKEIASENPTIITLYPKNSKKREEINETIFLEDPELPCKCFQCKRKYDTLKILKHDQCETDIGCNGFTYTIPCAEEVPRMVQMCRQQWNCNHGLTGCVRPCTVEYTEEIQCRDFIEEESTLKGEGFFKYNAFGHHIDSNITEYFHSILDKAIYC